MPETIGHLIWYLFGLLATYFLWSIKREITSLRADNKEERDARGILESEVAAIKARCEERHKQ